MENTLPHFISYFRALVAAHGELQDFVHGPAARIIAGSRSKNTYPLLWLETPTLSLSDKDGTSPFGLRHSAFVVLHSAPSDDYEAQDAAWAQTEAIALDVLSYLRRAHKQRLITFVGLDGGQLEAVATPSVAGELGWRFEFSLGDFVPLTYDATRWQEGAPAA